MVVVMNKILCGTLLAVLSISNAYALNTCLTGSWYDPRNPGEGLALDVNPSYVSAYFFTYDYPKYLINPVAGADIPKTWFTSYFPNTLGFTVDFNIFDTKNYGFSTTNIVTHPVSKASISFVNNNEINFSYTVSYGEWEFCDFSPVPFFCNRSLQYKRLLPATVACQ